MRIKITKELLEKEYLQNKQSTIKIAKKYCYCSYTIRYYLKKFNIKVRTRSEALQKELNPNFGKHLSIETKLKLGQAISKKLQTPYYKNLLSKGRKDKHHTEKTKEKIKQGNLGKHQTEETKKKISLKHRKYTETEAIKNKSIRGWTKWKKFRIKILIKDNYICWMCKEKANQIHHILPKKVFPEFCWDKWNVISVCDCCHKKIEPRINFRRK